MLLKELVAERTKRSSWISPLGGPEQAGSAAVADRITIGLCITAILFLLYGMLLRPRPNTVQAAPPPVIDSGEPLISGTGFAKDAVEPLPPDPDFYGVRGAIRLYGSHIGDDSSTGSVHTRWYRAVPNIYLFVTGYPNRPGNRLTLEVITANSGTVHLPVVPFEDPGGTWLLKRIPLIQIQGAKAFRIVAVDGSTKPGDWVGFSEPFVDVRSSGPLLLKQTLLVILAVAAAIVGLLSPGLIIRQKRYRSSGRLTSLVWVPVPGILLLALLGTIAWLESYRLRPVPDWFSPATICRAGLSVIVLYAGYHFLRYPLSSFTRQTERRALFILLMLIALSVGKSLYSPGPVGELFHDEISRTLEIGGRSDSRTPYFVVQLGGRAETPFGPFSRELFETWTFSDRGPIAALASMPIVLAGPVSILNHKPQDPWTIFDHRGFMAYRISMITIASSTLLFIFGLSRLFLSEEWALLASLVTMGSPFVIHDIYYTWPKLIAAGFVLLAAYLVLQGRPFFAGLAIGVGYLCHPSALLFTPAVVAVMVLSTDSSDASSGLSIRKVLRWVLRTAVMMGGLGIWMILWRLINGEHYTQNQFFSFFLAAGVLPQTISNWLRYRLETLLNTLVPLYLVIFHPTDDNINAIEGPSPAVVHFFLQPWCSIPFGTGVIYFFCLIRLLAMAVWKAGLWLLLVFCIPFLIFVAYMGVDSSGLLKDGLHAWFLGLMIFSVVIWCRFSQQSRVFWKVCSWALLLRGLETLSMMLLPTIWTRHELVQPPFVGTDALALLTMIVGIAWLYWYTFWASENLRKHALPVGAVNVTG